MPSSPPHARPQRRDTRAAALSRVLATVTHEIRTPLSGIVGLADLLAGTETTPEQMSYIEAIRTSGLALASLVDELLDISRIEAGKVDLADEPVDIAALVEGVVELLAPRAQGKGLEIASFVAPDVPAAVFGDAGRLRQIVLNLAGNAVKFTVHGGVGVRVEATGQRLRIRVEDSGPGVPSARRTAIFDPFEQGGVAEGTGLGLTIARRLAVRMGGGLELEATSAAGSTFCADLPLRRASPIPQVEDLAGCTVLIVGDGRFGLAYLARLLEASGANVLRASDPVTAAAMMTGRPLSALLVDGALGSVAVQALAVSARLAASSARSLILVSPYERRAFGPLIVGGYDGWLIKPVRTRSLFLQIDRFATRRQSGAPASARRFKVLVAEDDAVNARLAMRHLERLGAEVAHVADGMAALKAWQAASSEGTPFDVGLFDLRMPGLSGSRLAEAVRASLPPRGRLLAMSAGPVAADVAALFDEVLAKPVDLGRLGRALERA